MRKIGEVILLIGKRIVKDLWRNKIVILCLFLYWLFARFVLHIFCPMVFLTGLPCPGCGLTRATRALLCGNFVKAFYYNPSIFGWGIFGGAFLYFRYIRNKVLPHLKLFAAIISGITILIYLYRMIFVFPGNEPMTYQYRNVFSILFPFYDSMLKSIWKL